MTIWRNNDNSNNKKWLSHSAHNSMKLYKILSSASRVTMPDKLIKIVQYIKPDKCMTASDYARKFLGASFVTHLNATKSKNLGNWIAFRLEHLPAYNVIKCLLRTKLLSDYIPTYNTANIFEELSCFPTTFQLTILSNAFGNIERSCLLSSQYNSTRHCTQKGPAILNP